MIDNSLIPTQNINATDAPQPTATNIGASDASPFQQAASADALKQNTSIQVASNGNPITGGNNVSTGSNAPLILLVATLIVLGLIAAYMLRAFKLPMPKDLEIAEIPEQKVVKKIAKSKPKSKPKPKPKKVARSKRRKN